MKTKLPYLSVAFLLCPSFTLTPMACFTDALRLAADRHDESKQVFFKWGYASTSEGEVISSSGLPVSSTIGLSDLGEFDCIVVCGGLLRDFEEIPSSVFTLLAELHDQGKMIIGLCTGSFALAKAGLLNGKSCAVQANVLRDFVSMFRDTTPVTNKNYWIEGNVITCPGGILSLDVAAHVIRHSSDLSRTYKALDYMLFNYENPRQYFPKRPYQEQYDKAGALTQHVIQMMETNIDEPVSISELATRLATTRTRITRQFIEDMAISPGKFWMELRLDIACQLLLEKDLSITEIGYNVGFNDTAHFCKRFKDRYEVSPNSYRQKFTNKSV